MNGSENSRPETPTAGTDEGARAAAKVPMVRVAEARGELARVYRRLGYAERAAHIVAVQSLHPRALEAHIRLYRTLMYGPSPLSRAEREALAVLVSARNDCFY